MAASGLLQCKLHSFSLPSAPVSGHEDQRTGHGDIEHARFCAAIYKANWNTAVPLGSWRGSRNCLHVQGKARHVKASGRTGAPSPLWGPHRGPPKRALLHLLSAPLFTVVIQSLSRVRLFATPWIVALQASLSFTISQSLLRLTSTESVMPSNHLILCRALLLLPSIFPSIRVFSRVGSSHQVGKVLEPQHPTFQRIFRVDFLQD